MTRVYLSLGSNEGDRMNYLSQAVEMLADAFDSEIVTSPVYETEPWGITDQPRFLNMCVALDTDLQPLESLEKINEIEALLGRLRKKHWGKRTLDIDIIFFGDVVIDTEKLTIPHKYMQERAFVLVPLKDIAAEFVHPVLQKTIEQLFEELPKEKMTCLGYLPK